MQLFYVSLSLYVDQVPYNTRQDVTILESELTNAKNLSGLHRQDKDKVTVGRMTPISLVTNVEKDDAQMQSVDRNLYVAQAKLRDNSVCQRVVGSSDLEGSGRVVKCLRESVGSFGRGILISV